MVGKIIDSLNKLPASQLLNSLIDKAIETNASFIHIEPSEQEIAVRFRVDGSLIEWGRFSKEEFNIFIDKIKTLANLDINTQNIPQDGKFKLTNNDSSYTFRVATLPTIDGEKISINILNGSIEAPKLSDLGLWGYGLNSLHKVLSGLNGLIILSGPRHSGKSLGLFAMLNSLSNSNAKIATIEDPVEYRIKNAIQTQVNHKTKLTFYTGLKTLDKHDIDIVMISELRDKDITNLVFHEASRDKLILSSMYSDSFDNAIDRLNDMGVSRSQISRSLRLFISQRLVRQLCSDCRESFKPNKTFLNLLDEVFDLKNPEKMKLIHRLEAALTNEILKNSNDDEVNQVKGLSTTETRVKILWHEHQGGCDSCSHTGFKGSMGLYEVINISPSIVKSMTSLASADVLVNQALKEGTIKILDDGLIKSLRGQVSIHEIIALESTRI